MHFGGDNCVCVLGGGGTDRIKSVTFRLALRVNRLYLGYVYMNWYAWIFQTLNTWPVWFIFLATAYGEGVYFAINSSYSAQPKYSAADSHTANCYIYQCKVLTGCTIKGNSKMRFLPKRVGQTLYDSATDNVNKPSMFVIFSDTQAYPEYLITFKKHVSYN